MNLFGYEIALRIRKKAATNLPIEQVIFPPANSGSGSWNWFWPGLVREPYAGAWQENVVGQPMTSPLAFSAVFACVTGISSDVAKLRIKLVENSEGVWKEVTAHQPWLPVLRKPNHYQNRIKFIESWIVSKLLDGNTYILKKREDERRIVTHLYPLDPRRVLPLVAPSGDVFYELNTDNLSGLPEKVVVPASEIIHDRGICLFHPLIGVPPMYAAALSASMGIKIQSNSTNLFGNAARPGGVLTAPGHIQDDTAKRLKEAFEQNFSGPNVGRLAVLGDGLKFEPMIMTAEAAQTAEQLKFTVEDVGRCFHYPAWKMGGAMPPYSSGPAALTTMYYTDCLQTLIECVELSLDEGLELKPGIGTELDLDNLMRLDKPALYDMLNKAKDWMKVDEQRFRADLEPLPMGGDTVYRQHQDYSIESLAKRDALDDPFGTSKPAAGSTAPSVPTPEPTKQMSIEDIDFFEQELALQ